MADLLYDRVLFQLRAKEGFTGLMNQSRQFDDAFNIVEGRITDEHGFVNDHSFKLDKTANLFRSYSTYFYRNIAAQINYTFECRIRFNTLTENAFILQMNGSTAVNSRALGVSSAGKMVYYSDAAPHATQTDAAVIATNTDYHLAFVRATNGTTIGNRLLMFLNGVKVYDAANTSYNHKTVSATTSYLILGGSRWISTNRIDGYIDDIRFTLGARYLDNFTPPDNDDFFEPETPDWYIARPSREGRLNLPSDTIVRQVVPAKTKYFNIAFDKTHSIQDRKIGNDIQVPSVVYMPNPIRDNLVELKNVYGQNNIEATVLIDNEPASGMVVHLMQRSNKQIIRSTISDENGNYSFKNVAPNINYVIYAEDSINKPTNLRKNAYVRDFVRLNAKQVCIVGNRNISGTQTYMLKAYGLTEPTTFTFTTAANITYSTPSITLTPQNNIKEFKVTASVAGVYNLSIEPIGDFEVVSKTIVRQ